MDNNKQQIAADFDQYQAFTTDEERQEFWDGVEKRVNELTPDQRLTAQTGVREDINQILQRMQTIVARLAETEQVTVQ